MSVLRPGDTELHYSDGSHRWPCPIENATDEDCREWVERVSAHVDYHRAGYDTPDVRRSLRVRGMSNA